MQVIKKRCGRIVKYDKERIVKAVSAAMGATSGGI